MDKLYDKSTAIFTPEQPKSNARLTAEVENRMPSEDPLREIHGSNYYENRLKWDRRVQEQQQREEVQAKANEALANSKQCSRTGISGFMNILKSSNSPLARYQRGH